MKEKNDEEPVFGVQEFQKGDLMAVEKVNVDGQAFQKQRRDNVMELNELMNKAPVVRPPMDVPEPRRKRKKTYKINKASGDLQDHVKKYNLVTDLHSVSPGMNFGQLLSGDAEEPGNQLKRLFSKTVPVRMSR